MRLGFFDIVLECRAKMIEFFCVRRQGSELFLRKDAKPIQERMS
jgi:hypothetical protein